MEQTKRSRNNCIHDYDDSKRKKINRTTVESHYVITRFEELSNELIYEIFEFVDYHQAFESFYDLNTRFANLFVRSNIPIKINIESISKLIFRRYLSHIIIPYTYRIRSLRLSNPFVADMILLLSPIMINLTRLEALTLNNIECDYVEAIIDRLCFLPVLSSLTIISVGRIKNQNDIYQKIFRLSALKYCRIFIEALRYRIPLPIAMSEFSPIEHLIIDNRVSINKLDGLLSYIPQIRRLSFGHFNGWNNRATHRSSITLTYLTDVSLELYYFSSFNDFELLITDFFRSVQVLRIVKHYGRYSYLDFLNADRWERLISTHMLNLRIFDFQYQYQYYTRFDDNGPQLNEAFNKFDSLFWMKHQWFFEHQYYRTGRANNIIFYSTDPYRRKSYMLHEESNRSIWASCLETNVDSVDHVYIHNNNAMKQFLGHFPNATELTVSNTFGAPRDFIVASLNRIIPLRQLIQITLGIHRFPFKQVIKLLHFTPNVRTLKLYSILLQQTDSLSFQQNQIFQTVSKMNNITNVTIDKESNLDKIQLLVALFPRLEYLTINVHADAFESIARFLLSKPNNNTRYLSSLCISKKQTDFLGKMSILIGSEKLLHDYTIKFINHELYLWW